MRSIVLGAHPSVTVVTQGKCAFEWSPPFPFHIFGSLVRQLIGMTLRSRTLPVQIRCRKIAVVAGTALDIVPVSKSSDLLSCVCLPTVPHYIVDGLDRCHQMEKFSISQPSVNFPHPFPPSHRSRSSRRDISLSVYPECFLRGFKNSLKGIHSS